jgi:two-component system, response regulator PdtaR
MEPFGFSRLIIGMTAHPQTILVVEDEPFIRICAVDMLEDAGFWVLEAQDSAEALKILAHNDDISILLTDVRMPGRMDGLALVAEVCTTHPNIRSIVVSANASAEQASDAGAVVFLTKPYTARTIVQAIHDTVPEH